MIGIIDNTEDVLWITDAIETVDDRQFPVPIKYNYLRRVEIFCSTAPDLHVILDFNNLGSSNDISSFSIWINDYDQEMYVVRMALLFFSYAQLSVLALDSSNNNDIHNPILKLGLVPPISEFYGKDLSGDITARVVFSDSNTEDIPEFGEDDKPKKLISLPRLKDTLDGMKNIYLHEIPSRDDITNLFK